MVIFYIEHFINWVSTAGLPTFKKLWGKIEHDLDKGDYSITIENNYDISAFDGKKSVIITTTSNLGGKMSFLGIISLIVGSISIIGGLAIIGIVYYSKKKGITI